MPISDIFNASKIKQENEELKKLLTPELQSISNQQKYIQELEIKLESLQQKISVQEKQLSWYSSEIDIKKQQLLDINDAISFQEFGLYTPRYQFKNADGYKERLALVRQKQKELIKSKKAVSGNMKMTYNGSVKEGNKLVSDMQKLLLRAFNSECDDLVSKVKYNNFDTSLKRITSSRDAISKLGTRMQIAITKMYYDLKIEELHLAFEYQVKRQEEKEEQKEARSRMREAAKLQKELDEQRKKVEKEQSHYQKALISVIKQLEQSGNNNADLIKKKKELEEHLGEIDTSLKDLDYREANQKAGYVYVISNIGAFGPDVYKIGMTRRLDPQERVDELGDASVPFKFDVHAMMFSDNAPALENALHKAFDDKKVNMVNHRKEFFHVTLEEIKEVVRKNYDKTIEFVDIPDAEQYRTSEKMRSENFTPRNKPMPTKQQESLSQAKGSSLSMQEIEILSYIQKLSDAKEVYYKKIDDIAYIYTTTPDKWIANIKQHPKENWLLTVHPFKGQNYETEYYFDNPDQLEQLQELFTQVYQLCTKL